MKRPLDVVAGPSGSAGAGSTERVRLGDTVVSVESAASAADTQRFADLLFAAGGSRPGDEESASLRVVIRAPASGAAGARNQAELEANADVVLGSVRTGFAKRLAQSLLGE
ncbi:MAG: hypothetical protein AAGF92_01030 [Myxococcota bacterium]